MTTNTDIIDLIEHINEDHASELLGIAQVYMDGEASKAMLIDVDEKNLTMQIDIPSGSQQRSLAFTMSGDAEDKILFLAYEAMIKQRKLPSGSKTKYFRFIERQTISTNILRLVFSSEAPLPVDEPGYAFLFSLKALKPKQSYRNSELSEMPLGMRLGFKAMLGVMKILRPGTRRKLLKSMYNSSRYFTLRKNIPGESDGQNIAWVDIFVHGDSPGSRWAKSLTPGDMIKTTAEYEEKTQHLKQGQALLIADETAMPTLAAILENWQNPTAPIIVLISTAEDDQDYINSALIPLESQLHRLVGETTAALTKLKTILESAPNIDTAWGALEHGDAKAVRAILRESHGLAASKNRVRGYWQRDEG